MEFALAWYLTIKTGSATVLATSMLTAMLPTIILGPIIGPLVDRWNRKWIMVLADTSISLLTVGLVLLFLFDKIQVWHIYVAMVGRAIGQTFHFPAMQAAIPMIVPEKDLSRAAGLNQMLQGAITIAAPPAGALLLGLMPMQGVLAIDIVTAAIAIVCILPMVIPQPERTVSAVKSSVVSDMLQGFRYIWNWKGLKIMLAVFAAINFFLIPAYTLLPMLVTRLLDGDVFKLGWLQTAFGVGAIAGGLVLGAWGGFKRRVVTALLGVILAGAATLVLGFTSLNLFWLGLTASFLIGVGLSFCNGPMMAAVQSIVAKDMQGRVFALLGSLGGAATPLGLLIAGPAADASGISWVFFVSGAATALCGLVSFFIPTLMNLEKEAEKANARVAEAQ